LENTLILYSTSKLTKFIHLFIVFHQIKYITVKHFSFKALVLCHNVTPVFESDSDSGDGDNNDAAEADRDVAVTIGEDGVRRNVTYQVRERKSKRQIKRERVKERERVRERERERKKERDKKIQREKKE
jgi:hypothetical protein